VPVYNIARYLYYRYVLSIATVILQMRAQFTTIAAAATTTFILLLQNAMTFAQDAPPDSGIISPVARLDKSAVNQRDVNPGISKRQLYCPAGSYACNGECFYLTFHQRYITFILQIYRWSWRVLRYRNLLYRRFKRLPWMLP